MGSANCLKEGERKGMAKGLAEGEKKGRAKGLEEGEAKGKQQAQAEMVWKLYAKGKSIPEISGLTELSEADVWKMVEALE